MKIVCFGDSLTRGISFVRGRMRIIKDNYPAALSKLAESLPFVEVLNKGVFNDNSDLLVSRLEKDVLSEQPDIVLIEVGGNDCNFKWEEVAENPAHKHEPIVPIDRYLENITLLVKSFQEKHITPFLLTLPPLDPARYYGNIAGKFGPSLGHFISCVGGIEHWHGMYNRRLKTLAHELKVPLIDVRTHIKSAGDLRQLISDDGIHLTSEGYGQMSRIVFESLQNHLQLNRASQ
ncbi:SGNH/GDSL hydrolase family protein [Bacillus massiliglaciei]|uniref:SGNH/GDSL hydrolase family protein n=1 Tax=Bacillus massiliglaciei TaxID=1816693 RepID=UPI000B13905A|nr:SGNH/GDSL hydrolase family protein [Bacillus massiliglaciei]